ncbi:hypothetical protein F9817_13710 [Vibrio sp. CAIM 722]|uniref:YtxH domain-containing protein n=1 Tax=Vibrio eleionomae TaxID=2653505 RepID=A0A7X4RUV5_9VIBR|nr:hypothetical protein [Vibrio eleionomae]MZI94251.1 hypothetical protein [Vibrio eleionomae]
MLKYIVIILVVIGIYIGVTYKDDITGKVGQDRVESIQEHVNDTIEHGKETMKNTLDKINNE